MAVAEYSKLFVVLMGIGTVFFGLICIIFLTMIMGKVMVSMQPKQQPTKAGDTMAEVKKVAEAHPQTPDAVSQDVLAVIMAVLSEEQGTSSRGWNITSIKKSI